jgi:hypothetical protein
VTSKKEGQFEDTKISDCSQHYSYKVLTYSIWRQIPNEDHTIILDGFPDATVSSLTDLTSPSSGGHNQDTSHTRDRINLCKVHFSNQANDQMAATESTGGTTQPDLIDYINDHLGVDFNMLQVQVAARKKAQAIS